MKNAFIVAVILTGLVAAQPPRGLGGGPRTAGPENRLYLGPPQGKEMRGPKSKKQMEMMIMWRLTEHLELTEDQAAVFFPKFKKHRDEMDQIEDQLRDLGEDVREMLDDGEKVSDKYLKSTLDKISDLEQKKIKARRSFLESLNGTLTNDQILKLSVFERRFKREIKQRMREEYQGYPGGRMRGMP